MERMKEEEEEEEAFFIDKALLRLYLSNKSERWSVILDSR